MDHLDDDADDWNRALRGDGRAFGRLFDRHRSRIRRHAVGLVPDPQDADDVVAVVFLEAWRKRDSVRVVGGSILPWLLVAATNVARNLTRSARRHRVFLDRLPPPDPAPDHADAFAADDATAALARLSLTDQQVLTLCTLEGLSEREAAETLGVAPGTVKSRLHRAKARLRGELTDTAPSSLTPEASHERP